MLTRWSSKVETVVAEDPMLIFRISPMVSLSIGESKFSILESLGSIEITLRS